MAAALFVFSGAASRDPGHALRRGAPLN